MEYDLKTSKKEELKEITDLVIKTVEESSVAEGLCIVYCPHTTAGITINENADPDVVTDILKSLNDMVKDIGFNHSEGNSIAHVKSSMIGCSETIPITNGCLSLGTWQGIYFTEFDGPRNRRVIVRIIGEK